MSPKRKEAPLWAKLGHAKPTTRREFLASGAIPFAAWAVGPSLASLLSPARAVAAGNCATASSQSYIPFITVNLQGGAGLSGNVVVKDLGGLPLRSYSKLGLGSGPDRSFSITKEFGNVDFPGTAIGGNTQGLVSKFLMGLRNPRNVANAPRNSALDQAAFIWQAVASGDDSNMNPFDVTGLVLKMGLQGSKLPNLGRRNSSTGIAQQPAVLPPPSPFVVTNVNDLANAIGYATALQNLSTGQKSSLSKLISSLSGSQINRFSQLPGATSVTSLIECAGLKNIELIESGGGDVNPFSTSTVSAELARIWSVNLGDANSRTRSQGAIFGAMIYNGLMSNASTVNLDMGGYDYHDGTRTRGDSRDLEAGSVVGKILETAQYLKKPVFVYVCSDGSTSSAESTTADSPWMSDRGIAGLQYMIAYHPTARPTVTGNQIGGFNVAQAADGKFATANNPELAAQAVFANYASWNDRMDFVEQNRILGDAALRSQAVKLVKG